MSWLIVTPVVLSFLFLLVFLVERNLADKRELKKKLNNDYHTGSSDHEGIEMNS